MLKTRAVSAVQLGKRRQLATRLMEACSSRPPTANLKRDLMDEGVRVWADRQGVYAILDNLLDNAIKYTLPGGRMTIRWWYDDHAAVLQVEDTGIGIAPEDQQRIFERFYRVDKARSRASWAREPT